MLAVAGSGKSSTLAYRIRHLVADKLVPPAAILVLMFNALARRQFREHLSRAGVAPEDQPAVHTFHSFCYRILQAELAAGGLPERTQFWIGERQELVWLQLNRSLRALEKGHRIAVDGIDPEQALQAISLWKEALVPLIVAARMLGHQRPSVTLDIYGHLYHDKQSQAAEILEGLIGPTLLALPERAGMIIDVE